MSTQELDYLTVRGFKSIVSIEKLKLGPINILIGPNGSGKSNFIEVFAFLHALREGGLQDYVGKAGGADAVLNFGSKHTPQIELHISFAEETNQYEISLVPTDADELFPKDETVYFWNKQKYPQPLDISLGRRGMEAGISDGQLSDTPGWVRDRLSRWRIYHFHDTSSESPMKKAADVNDNYYLRTDASNLAAFLYVLKMRQAEAYELIRKTVQRVTPFFDDFELQPMQLNPNKIQIQWRHRNSDKYFGASSLSDGTLRFMALSTLFLQPDTYRPSVILVDEPELGLHPYAITMLASLIKMASKETQVIVSTQSPMLLDHFKPEDVLVVNRVKSGTVLERLSTQKLESWLEEYSLGQLWEKNELGGRPVRD